MESVIGTSERCPLCGGFLEVTPSNGGVDGWIRVAGPDLWEYSGRPPVGLEAEGSPGPYACKGCKRVFARIVQPASE